MSQAANSKVNLFGNGFTNASDAKTVLWTAAFTTTIILKHVQPPFPKSWNIM